MEEESLVPADGLKMGLQNGSHEHLSVTGEDGIPDLSEAVDKTMDTANVTLSTWESKEQSDVKFNGLTISNTEDSEEKKAADCDEQLKLQKSQPKSKKEILSSPKYVASLVKKTKGGVNAEPSSSVLNGSSISHERGTQKPIKNRSSNNMQPQLSEQPRNSDGEGLGEITNLNPLKNDCLNSNDEESQMSSSSVAEDVKPHRTGRLPNYNFSFRCNERAEKRKEFYSKLEEKMHEMEADKNNLEAKSKETQEAELKMLRKSLTFKATPLPSFYQEPPPPQAELKKTPPTRAKSPKLGRKKISNAADSEANNCCSAQSARLSLEESGSNKPNVKAFFCSHAEKPQRKSLPRLPSEKTTLFNPTNKARTSSSKAKQVEKSSSSNGKTDENQALPVAENKSNALFHATNEEEMEKFISPNISNEEAKYMSQQEEEFPAAGTAA